MIELHILLCSLCQYVVVAIGLDISEKIMLLLRNTMSNKSLGVTCNAVST